VCPDKKENSASVKTQSNSKRTNSVLPWQLTKTRKGKETVWGQGGAGLGRTVKIEEKGNHGWNTAEKSFSPAPLPTGKGEKNWTWKKGKGSREQPE